MERTGIQKLLFSQKLPSRQFLDRNESGDLGRFLFDRAETDSESSDPLFERDTLAPNHFTAHTLNRSALPGLTTRSTARDPMRGWFQMQPKSAVKNPTRSIHGTALQTGVPGAAAQTPVHSSSPHSATALHGTAQRPANSLLASVLQAVDALTRSLMENPRFLLQVNSSRREAIARHLERLAQIHPGPSTSSGAADAAGGLLRWIEDPRTEIQTEALKIYCEELAVFSAAQALLLKTWSDRGIRTLKEDEMSSLNWALASALKPHVPLDRDGWSVTRNLYSWFTPSPAFQGDLWRILSEARLSDEGPDLILQLVRFGRKTPIRNEASEYDERFMNALWKLVGRLGLLEAASSGPIRRKRSAFCPTLRDGTIVRTGPTAWNWFGLESNPFHLSVAELAQLWWGPSPPPLWACGSGLEVHPRDQLSLSLGTFKPSLYSRMSENESCDLAIVMEEKTVRTQGRGCESQRLREQLDQLPYFRKLRGTQTSQGIMQAAVALTRLRPGGYLIWARESPLGATENPEALQFLLEQGTLQAEWNFSELDHSLPGRARIVPRYLYVFRRESEMRVRLAHRPRRITVQGAVRSHVEVPLLLDDALSAISIGAPNEMPIVARGNGQVHVQISPLEQREWMDRWPDHSDLGTLNQLESLRLNARTLAAFTTIRVTPPGDPKRGGLWTLPVRSPALGFWVHSVEENGRRRIISAPLPKDPDGAPGAGVQIIVRDDSWTAPLCAYLESRVVAEWLDLHCERRNEQWLLNEAIVRLIPVPLALLQFLGASEDSESPENRSFATPLPGEWERLGAEIGLDPKKALASLPALDRDPRLAAEAVRIRTSFFVRAARLIEQVRRQHGKLFSLVGEDGALKWRELLRILPASELIPATQHPLVRVSGTIPPQLMISKISRVKAPVAGFFLATDSGLHLHIGSQSARILEILGDQLQGIENVNWQELHSYLILPRSLELADAAAKDIVKAHGDQTRLLQELQDLLYACSKF